MTQMTQKAVKRNGIIPNETRWNSSRTAKNFLSGKKYSLCTAEEQVSLPDGFRRPSSEMFDVISSLIPGLNDFNITKFTRVVEVAFECDGSITASSLKQRGRLFSAIKDANNGVGGGFRRSFDGSPLEIGDVIDGAFKSAIECSEEMTTANRVTTSHPIFERDVSGACDGMFQGRPVEVKSVNSLSESYIRRTLNGNNLQFAAYNWLYGKAPIIVIVSRQNLKIDVVVPTYDLVEEAMLTWATWADQVSETKSSRDDFNHRGRGNKSGSNRETISPSV